MQPKVFNGRPIFAPEFYDSLSSRRDDDPLWGRGHEPRADPGRDGALDDTAVVPHECLEVAVQVEPALEALGHAQRRVRPHPAVLVEQENPDHVTLGLDRQFLPHLGPYEVEEARGVDGAFHVELGDPERWVGGPVRPEAGLLHRRGILNTLVPQGPDMSWYVWFFQLSWPPSCQRNSFLQNIVCHGRGRPQCLPFRDITKLTETTT